MFRDLDLGIATSVVDSVISAACNDYYNIHPNERGPIVTLSEKPTVTRSVFEPTQHLSESFVRYSKDDEITVCDSAVDSILSGALEQYYCLHPEERARPIRLEKQQPIVPELSVAAGQQRRSVDFLTLPLEEVVANEVISGALEEYYRIHGDQRPNLARLSLNNDSNVSNSKRRSSSSVQPGFISPRKTIDEEVVDSVISSALHDYYNLHPNERVAQRELNVTGAGSLDSLPKIDGAKLKETGLGSKEEGQATTKGVPASPEAFPSIQKPQPFPSMSKPPSTEAFPSMAKPPSTEAFPSMQKPQGSQPFPSMARPPSTESFPSMQKPQPFPSMSKPPSTEAFPSMAKPPSTEAFPSMQKPQGSQPFPSMARPPSTESFPSMQKPQGSQPFPSMARPPSTESFPSMQKPQGAQPFPSMAKPPSTEAFPSMARPPSTEAFPSMQKPPAAQPFPSMSKPQGAQPFPSMSKPQGAQPFPSMQKPQGAQPFPSMARPPAAGQQSPFPSMAQTRPGMSTGESFPQPGMVRSNTDGSIAERAGYPLRFSTEDWVERVMQEAIADYKQMKQSIGMPQSSSQQRFNTERVKTDRRPPLPRAQSPSPQTPSLSIPEISDAFVTQAMNDALNDYYRAHPNLKKPVGPTIVVSRDLKKTIHAASVEPTNIAPVNKVWTREGFLDEVISESLEAYYLKHPEKRHGQSGAGFPSMGGSGRAPVPGLPRPPSLDALRAGGTGQKPQPFPSMQKPQGSQPFPSMAKPPSTEAFPSMAKPPSTEAFPSMQKPPAAQPFPSMARPPSTEAFPSMQKPQGGQPFPSMQKPPSTEAFPSMQKPQGAQPFPSMARPPSTEAFPSMAKPPSTEAFPSMQKPPAAQPFPSMAKPPSTEAFPSMQKPQGGQPFPSMAKPPSTEAFPSMQKPQGAQPFPSMAKPPSTEAFPSMAKPPSTEAFPSMQKPQTAQPFPSMAKPPSTEAFPSMAKPPSTEAFPSMQKPPSTEAFPSMQKPPSAQPFPSMARPPSTESFPSVQKPQEAQPFPSMTKPAPTEAFPSVQNPSQTPKPDDLCNSPHTSAGFTPGQQRKSVDFLTLPLEEVVANEVISGALEEYYRIHGDQRPNLARLSLNNDSNVSNSKRRSSSSVQPGFISPRKTIDEEVVDSVISSALHDYYNLHPNERPRRVSCESTPKSEPQPSRATTNVPMRPRGPIDEEIADSVIQNALAQYYSVHPEARPRNS